MKELLQHIIDAERVFVYRALRFARKDSTPLASFEENSWAANSMASHRKWRELVDEFELVRRGNLLLFGGFDGEAWVRRGVANGVTLSVRAMVYAIAGHELHHLRIVRERYLKEKVR